MDGPLFGTDCAGDVSVEFDHVPAASLLVESVYILGDEIETLINTYKTAGDYEINFYANNLSSGIYLYTLQYGKITETKKMLLLQ